MKKFFILLAGFLLSSIWGFSQEYQPYLSQDEVMSSVRLLPPPPQEGSIEFLLDKIAYWEYFKLRTDNPDRAAEAIADADMSDIGHKFEGAFGLRVSKETMPETWLLLARARECFGSSGCNEAKQYYKRQRPFDYFGSHTLTPDDDEWLLTNFSYPSGHTANYWGVGYILAELRPECSEAILQRAEQGGISRLIVGAHWASDVTAGRMVAASVFQILKNDSEFQAQFKKAKLEVQSALAMTNSIVNDSTMPIEQEVQEAKTRKQIILEAANSVYSTLTNKTEKRLMKRLIRGIKSDRLENIMRHYTLSEAQMTVSLWERTRDKIIELYPGVLPPEQIERSLARFGQYYQQMGQSEY